MDSVKALLFPGLAGLHGGGEHVARLGMAVVDVVLLGVQAAAPAAFAARHTGGLFAGAEPRLARLGPQVIVGIELRAGLHERRRRDDGAWLRVLGVVRVVINLVGVANRAGKQHDVARLNGKLFHGHYRLPHRDQGGMEPNRCHYAHGTHRAGTPSQGSTSRAAAESG